LPVGLLAALAVGPAGCGAARASASHPATRRGAPTKPAWELALVRHGDLFLVTAQTRTPRRLTAGLAASYPLFSPDGRYVAFLDGQDPLDGKARLAVVGTDGQGLRIFRSPKAAFPGFYAWNPTQDVLAAWG
jgi:hypothetical protein